MRSQNGPPCSVLHPTPPRILLDDKKFHSINMRRRLSKFWCKRQYDEVYSDVYSLSYIESASLLTKNPSVMRPKQTPSLPPVESASFSFASLEDSYDGFLEGKTRVDLLQIGMELEAKRKEREIAQSTNLLKELNPTATIEERDSIEIVRLCDPADTGNEREQSEPTRGRHVDVAQYHAKVRQNRARRKSADESPVKSALLRMRRSAMRYHHFDMITEDGSDLPTIRSTETSKSPPSRINVDSDSISFADSISTL